LTGGTGSLEWQPTGR